MMTFPLTLLGTLAALTVYVWASIPVGQARGKFGVKAPSVTGPPEFERAFRAHQNTMEQLVLFLPLVWIVATLFGDLWGGIYAAAWVVGRIAYVIGYIKDPEKRGVGFLISGLPSLAALVGAIVAVVIDLVR